MIKPTKSEFRALAPGQVWSVLKNPHDVRYQVVERGNDPHARLGERTWVCIVGDDYRSAITRPADYEVWVWGTDT